MNKIVRRIGYLTGMAVICLSVSQPILLKVLPDLGGVAFAFAGGDGSAGDPYQIATCDDLENMTTGDDTVHYMLTHDIDCAGVNGGTGFVPIGGFNVSQFKGVLDGQNHTVSNITIDAADQVYVGMFGVVESATIKNLKLDHTTINNASYGAGTLAGYMFYTTVRHVSSTNLVINEFDDGWNVGGLVGFFGSGDGGVTLNTLDTSSAQGTINSSVSGGAAYGGLVGELDYNTVSNSYADVAINATGIQRVGGLVGYSFYGHIDKNYAVGSLDVYSDAGGLVGWGYTNSHVTNNFAAASITTVNGNTGGMAGQLNGTGLTVTNNYYDETATGQTQCDATLFGSGCTGVNADGLDSAHFKNNSTVAPLSSWDFVNTWQTTVNYPTLQDADVSATVPDSVRSLDGTPADGQIGLTWLAPSSNGGSAITDYLVRYRFHGSGSWSDIDTHSTLTSMAVTGLVDGTGYDLAVAAVNAVGTGAYSELDNLIPGTFPGAPTDVQATVSHDDLSITLDWSAPFSDGGLPITGYEVSIRDTDGANTWSAPVLLNSTTFTYTFDSLNDGDHYDVRVAAINAMGDGDDAMLGNLSIVVQVYDITTCEQLQAINNDLEGDYRLMNDIDCSDTTSWNGGAGFIPIDNGSLGGGFSGTLDGQGFAINDLFINSPDDDAGLFSALINGATVKNLTLNGQIAGGANTGGLVGVATEGVTIDYVTANVQVTVTDLDGGFFLASGAGGLVGLAALGVVVSHSSVTGFVVSMASNSEVEAVGGLIGIMLDGTTISDSYAKVEAGTETDGNFAIGGLAGMMVPFIGPGNIFIINSYATGLVAGADGAVMGGLVGFIGDSEIDNSFAANAIEMISGSPEIGGIIGQNLGSPIFNNVYFDQTFADFPFCTGSGDVDGCTGIDGDGDATDFFVGNHSNPPLDQWDFDTIWQLNAEDLPTLRAMPVTPADDGGAGSTSGSGGSSSTISEPKAKTPVIASPASDASNTTDKNDLTDIDLEQIADYVSGHGIALKLSVGQVLHFTVTRNGEVEQHSITVVSIQGDKVTLEIASKPFQLVLGVGETQTIQIEGQAAVKATLNAIDGAQANLSLSAVSSSQIPATHHQAIPDASKASMVTAGVIMAILFAGGALVVALKRHLPILR